jgi:hypothetical protein
MVCANCGTTILFGGIKDGNRKYCNKRCFEAGAINRLADAIPDSDAEILAANIHSGLCPKCSGEGPIDIHKSYSVYSVALYTKWQTSEHLLCKKCATKKQAIDLTSSFFLGWWGIPFGLIVTPIQIVRNVFSMFQFPDERNASDALKKRARLILATQKLENT